TFNVRKENIPRRPSYEYATTPPYNNPSPPGIAPGRPTGIYFRKKSRLRPR
ncbi:Hypothetical predicted protein, partial [Marmota monax]